MRNINRHIVSGLLIIMMCILAAGSSDSNNGKPREPDEISAFVMSEEFVKNRLKAPATADFPWYDRSFVSDLGGGRFKVSANVDSKNSFGAKIRTHYTCVLKYKGEDAWILESIELQ